MSVIAVFVFCLGVMGVICVSSSWKAQTDTEKRKWKIFWNHVEMVWLMSVFCTVLFALTPGWHRLAQTLPSLERAPADIEKNRITIDDWVRGFLEERCDPHKWPTLIEVCQVIQRIVDNKDMSSKKTRQFGRYG
jgi:hypothetical protein